MCGSDGQNSRSSAGVGASAKWIYGPTERHPRALWHLVQRRSPLHLVKADPERLRRIERPHDGRLAEAGQPRPGLLLSDLEIFPTHERMFAHDPDGLKDFGCPADPMRTIDRTGAWRRHET